MRQEKAKIGFRFTVYRQLVQTLFSRENTTEEKIMLVYLIKTISKRKSKNRVFRTLFSRENTTEDNEGLSDKSIK